MAPKMADPGPKTRTVRSHLYTFVIRWGAFSQRRLCDQSANSRTGKTRFQGATLELGWNTLRSPAKIVGPCRRSGPLRTLCLPPGTPFLYRRPWPSKAAIVPPRRTKPISARSPRQKITAIQSRMARQKLRRPTFPPPPNAQTKCMTSPIKGRAKTSRVMNHSPVVRGFSTGASSAMATSGIDCRPADNPIIQQADWRRAPDAAQKRDLA